MQKMVMNSKILKMLALCCAIGSTVSLSGCGGEGSVQAQSSPSTLATKDLSAFVNTYWYVPKDYLLGYSYSSLASPKITAVNDQTIWHFTSANGGYGSLLTVGSGQLTVSSGQPAFLMQMSAGVGATGLTHWAYMLPITSSDASWSSLPGTNNVSVPTATAAGC